MHRYELPRTVRERVIRRRGQLFSHETIGASSTALVVVDMQKFFVCEGFPAEVPTSRDIVSNINRLADALRVAGGIVVWLQTTATGAIESWGNYHNHMLTVELAEKRLLNLNESSEGYKLYPGLDVKETDLRVKKIKYSAFAPGSSNLDAELRSRGISTLLVAGTVTNVCCDSTARDAMLLDYRVIMLSDANAANTDEEHAAALNTFILFFGDVMTTDEAAAKIIR